MNANAKKWVEALRSGKYKQATGKLRNTGASNGYCCLGVACDLYRQENGGRWRGEKFYPGNGSRGDGILPHAVRDWLGLRSTHGTYGSGRLTTKNDEATFSDIANIVESEASLFGKPTWPEGRTTG